MLERRLEKNSFHTLISQHFRGTSRNKKRGNLSKKIYQLESFAIFSLNKMNVLWCCCSSIYSCLLCEFIGMAVWQSRCSVQMEELQARYGSFSVVDRVLKGNEGKIKSLHQIFFVATKSGGRLPYRTLQKCNILRVFFFSTFVLPLYLASPLLLFFFCMVELQNIFRIMQNTSQFSSISQATPVFKAIYLHALEAKGVYSGPAPKADFIHFVCIPNSALLLWGVESRIFGRIKSYFGAFFQHNFRRLI